MKLFTALHDKKKTWSNLIENPNMENRILESVSDKKIQELERELLNSKFNPPGQKHFWIRLQLGMAFGRELYFDMLKYSGGESDLVKKLASLSKDERDELYALSAEDIRLRLKMRILDDANAPVREFFQLRDVRPGEGSGRGGEGPGRGEGPMGRGGDGPGRGGDGPMGRGEGPGRGGEGPGRGEGPPPRMD